MLQGLRQIILGLLISGLFTTTAYAGKIYGVLQLQNTPLKNNTPLKFTCFGQDYHTKVRKYGRYSIYIKPQGSCVLSIEGYPTPAIRLNSYNEATRYNFILNPQGNSYSIQRN